MRNLDEDCWFRRLGGGVKQLSVCLSAGVQLDCTAQAESADLGRNAGVRLPSNLRGA